MKAEKSLINVVTLIVAIIIIIKKTMHVNNIKILCRKILSKLHIRYKECGSCYGGTQSVEGESYGTFAPEFYDIKCKNCSGTGYSLKKDY